MSDGTKIGYIARRIVNEPGQPAVCVRVSMVNSTRSQGESVDTGAKRFVFSGPQGVNELLVILNQVRHSDLTDKTSHEGFDYTLNCALGQGHGFPYCLNTKLETYQQLT